MKRLLVLSGKGGTGKTTISAALIKLSNSKSVADCDVDAPNLHLVMEQKNKAESSDFFGGDKAFVHSEKCISCGKCEENCRFDAIHIKHNKAIVNEFSCEGCAVCSFVCPQNAISLHKDVAGKIDLYKGEKVFSTATLKMGRGNSGKLVSQVKKELFKNSADCEIAIIDGSPGIGCPVIASTNGMDAVLIVTEPSKSGLSDLKRLVYTIKSFKISLFVCVNKYDTNIENTNKIESYCENEQLQFVGKIPFDHEAIKAVNNGKSIADVDCIAKKEIEKMYKIVKKSI